VTREMMRIPFHPLLVSLFLAASLMGRQPAPGERNAIVKPTIAMDASLQVHRGGEVEISLNAIPSYGNMETFVIQTPPSHGTLSDPKNSSDHTAKVVYRHDGGKEPLLDNFTFRVKAPGQALSAPANVSIKVIPLPPRLVFKPEVMDFGSVFLAGKGRANVSLTNLGGTRATGRLLLPMGFSAPNGDKYQLDEGESLSVPIEFSPMESRKYEERVIPLPSTYGASLILRGKGARRFEVTPVADGGQGEANWTFSNLSDQSLRIAFFSCSGVKGGTVGGWILPPEVVLTPNSETIVAFRQEESEGAISSTIASSSVRISDGLTEGLLELPPPRRFIPVTVHPNPVSDHLPMGGTLDLSFSLMNRSDLPKHLSWKITSALGGGMDQSEQVELHGGETREIQYHWKPTLPGQNNVFLSVDEGKKTHQELFWNVTVAQEGSAGSPRPGSAPEQKPAEAITQQEQESVAASVAVPVVMNSIQPIEGVKSEVSIPWIGNPKVLISWSTPTGSDGGMKIREALLMPPHEVASHAPMLSVGKERMKPMIMMHVDLRSLRTWGEAGVKKAAIRDLSPGSHLIVLSRIGNDGKVEACSQVSVFVPNPRSWWDSLKLPLGVIGVVFLILFLGRIRRG